jgi:hypothetical protein
MKSINGAGGAKFPYSHPPLTPLTLRKCEQCEGERRGETNTMNASFPMTAAAADHKRQSAGSNRLPVIASSINDHLAAADAATRRGLEHAIAAGHLLIEAKELVEHGNWLPWLKANCRIGTRQAQTWMRLARHRHRLDAIKYAPGAHLTIHAAEALVGRPRPERPHGLPGQLDMLGGPVVTADPASVGQTFVPTNAREIRALMGHVVSWLHNWSVADERRRFKIIQIIEHAGRLIEQLAHETAADLDSPPLRNERIRPTNCR